MNATRALLLSLAFAALGACSAVPTIAQPPTADSGDVARSYALGLIADYATWRATAAEGGDYVEDVLLPRALEDAGITAAVDDPAGALQAWASDATTTVETGLITALLYERVESLAEYPFDEVHMVVAKLIAEAGAAR